jgi:NADH-quinone oxidoreductase subunit J
VSAESVVFWVSGTFTVVGALGMVVSKKAVHSALWVAFAMINLAVLYFSLEAPFLGVSQIIVYTGAVMMLFLFVLMIVGVDSSDSLLETIKGQRLVATVLAFAFGAVIVASISSTLPSPSAGLANANANAGGHIQGISFLIFDEYVFAFEVLAALLITASVGAMVLANKERLTPRKTQDQMQRERTLGNHVTPLPAPGVLARSNSVDTPALLPDGSISMESLPDAYRSEGQVAKPNSIEEAGK